MIVFDMVMLSVFLSGVLTAMFALLWISYNRAMLLSVIPASDMLFREACSQRLSKHVCNKIFGDILEIFSLKIEHLVLLHLLQRYDFLHFYFF